MDSTPPFSEPRTDSLPTSEVHPAVQDSTATEAIVAQFSALDTRDVRVEFHGTGSEYFKIWIVNTALTILTLGIYSAWAKVRSRRYFYGNTRIEGSSFEYLARPKQILLGRILVGIFLIAVAVSSQVSLPAYGILLGVIFLVSPWILVKALRFNARYSAFRNVRFSFRGTVEDAYTIYFGLALLSLVSFGLAVPYMERRARSWLFSNHRYGNQPLRDSLTNGQVYKVYLEMFALGLLVAIPVVVLFVWMFASAAGPEGGGEPPFANATRWIFAAYASTLVAGLFLASFQYVHLSNLLLNGGELGRIVGFRSSMRTGTYFGLLLGYGLLTILTLGFAYPWMRVALARYRAATLVLRLRGSLDAVVGEALGAGSAIADQLAEGLDLDVDLGI
jgi:uncharacterized membrane protein YjgN (DUF898 family)